MLKKGKIDSTLNIEEKIISNAGLDEKENISKYLDILIPELETLLLLDLIPEQVKNVTNLLWEVKQRVSTTNWHLVLQGLKSYKATYAKLEKANLLEDYELHEHEVITEAIEELDIQI